jgi:hypothetical protein
LPHAPRILSASKRTDIPAFYLPWLLDRIARGWVDVPNPVLTPSLITTLREEAPQALPTAHRSRHARRAQLDAALEQPSWSREHDRQLARALTHVSLHPDDVLAIVWWSKNYAVYLRVADRLACYQRQHFHFTITPRRDDLRWIEPDVPPLDAVLAQARALVARFGPQALTWRYDPLVFWEEDGQPRSSWDPAFFEQVCRTLGSLGVRRCVTSIIDPYRKVVARWQRCFPERPLRQPDPEEVAAIGTAMVEIASAWGIQMEACAEPALAAVPGFVAAACIDATALAPECYAAPAQLALPLDPSGTHDPAAAASEAATGAAPQHASADQSAAAQLVVGEARPRREPPPATDRQFATRQACGCHRHIDIGDYAWQECGYSCLYCYARPRLLFRPGLSHGEAEHTGRRRRTSVNDPGLAPGEAELVHQR